MPDDTEGRPDRSGRLDFTRVTLPVMNRERVQLAAVGLGNGGGGVGIEAAAQENNSGIHTPRVAGCQMNLWSCSWTRTGSRSASTHSDSVFGSSPPWTGENRMAAGFVGIFHNTTSRANS